MNRKKRERAKAKRRRHPHRFVRQPTPAELALEEVREKAKRQKKGESYVLTQMQRRGYLPNGTGGWREMTEHERELWS